MNSICFIVLYSGEAEYEDCIESINNLTGYNVSIFEVKNQTKFSAHEQARAFMLKNIKRFDLFVKFDSDMIIYDYPMLYDQLRKILVSHKDFQRYTFPLYDHLTLASIYGVHLIRSRHLENLQEVDQLHTDNWISELRGINVDGRFMFADHGRKQTSRQMQRYIVQRFLKIDRARNYAQAEVFYKIIMNRRKSFRSKKAFLILLYCLQNHYAVADLNGKYLLKGSVYEKNIIKFLLRHLRFEVCKCLLTILKVNIVNFLYRNEIR